jgi:hypothetical protein
MHDGICMCLGLGSDKIGLPLTPGCGLTLRQCWFATYDKVRGGGVCVGGGEMCAVCDLHTHCVTLVHTCNINTLPFASVVKRQARASHLGG